MVKNTCFARQAISLIIGVFLCFTVQAVEAAAPSLELPQGAVILTVDGLINQTNINGQAQFDLAMIQALPTATVDTRTVVTDGIKQFSGVLLRDLLDLLGVSAQARQVEATALNDYLVDIPLADFYTYEVLLATHMDGQQLTPTDKGPLWIVYPRDQHRTLQDIRYDYRWVWQLKHLHIR